MATLKISFKKIAVSLFSLLVVFMFFVVIVNNSIFDEELHPEVKIALQVPSEINSQQNAYFALLGMQAAAEKDMQQVGIQLTARYLQNRDQHEQDELTQADINEIAGGKDLDEGWSKQYSPCNSRQVNGCLSEMLVQINSKPITDARFKVMLQRYQKLITMKQYQDLQYASAAMPSPQFIYPLNIAKIYLAQLSTENDPMIFLTAVQKDMKFWRMVLNQGNTIISKMIATAALWNDLQYLSEFMQNKTFTEQQLSLIKQLLTILNKDELDISESILGENRWIASEFVNIQKNWITRMAFQYKATLNTNYFYVIKPDVELAQLSSTKLAESILQGRMSNQSPLIWSPSSLYNLIGKWLVSLRHPNMQEYIARVHDLNGMILLVQLQLLLKNTPNEEIESSIKNSTIKNPYTNRAMEWDRAKGALEFKCLDVKVICRVKI